MEMATLCASHTDRSFVGGAHHLYKASGCWGGDVGTLRGFARPLLPRTRAPAGFKIFGLDSVSGQTYTMKCVNCPNCSQPVLPHERHCVRCQTDCGFPNVRAAQQPAEKNALAVRIKSAEDDAKSRHTEPVLDSFRDAVRKSRAVRVRAFAEVYGLVKSDNKLLGTFYDLKGAGLLRPAATEMEASRQS